MSLNRAFSIIAAGLIVLLLCTPAWADHTNLIADNGTLYRIDPSEGEVTDLTAPSSNDGCNSCWRLFVDGASFNGGNSSTALSDRELVSDPDSLSGLTVQRRSFVPVDGNFVRHLSIFTNPTAADITVDIEIRSELSATTSTVSSSSGDAAATTADFWAVLAPGANTAVGHTWGNTGAADAVDVVADPAGATSTFSTTWSNVTVPAGETVIYLTFGVGAVDAATAEPLITDLQAFALPDQQLLGVSATELAQIRNWSFPDSDSDGILDVIEIALGLDPNDASDAAGDLDSDGLSNLEEVNLGSDPQAADTDGDGLTDGDEVNTYSTSPLLIDSDADGTFDGGEVAVASDPAVNPFTPTAAKIILTDGLQEADQPVIAADTDGNLHLVWSEDDGADTEIRYAMLDAQGAVLIAPTSLTDNADRDRLPSLAVNSQNQVFVAWHDDNQATSLLRLNPAADDQDGDAANPAVLIDIAPVPVSADGKHVRVRVGGADALHLVWIQKSDATLHYASYDSALVNRVSDTLINSGVKEESRLGLASDSSGNVHMCWTGQVGDDSIYYAMLSGADGSVLIAPTVVTPLDNEHSLHTSLAVDAEDRVHIVWMDRQGESAGNNDTAEIWHTRLDPAADDQSGDAADATAITLLADHQISPDNGRESLYPSASLAADGYLYVTWNNETSTDDGNGQTIGPLYLMALNPDGSRATPPLTLATTPSEGNSNRNYAAYAGGFAAWSEPDAEGEQVVALQNVVVPPVATGPNGIIVATSSQGQVFNAETLTVSDLPQAAQDAAPAEVNFPDGLIRLTVGGLPVGATAAVTLNFPSEIPDGALYYKWDVNNGWRSFAYIKSDTNQIQLILTDGGAGDADGQANGQIVDPGGFTTSTATPAPPPATDVAVSGSGGGCTLNPNAGFDPLFPALLLLAIGYLLHRRLAHQSRKTLYQTLGLLLLIGLPLSAMADVVFVAGNVDDDHGPAGLYRVNAATGEVTQVGSTDLRLHALAAAADGTLYGIQRNFSGDAQLVIINPFTGAIITDVGPITVTGSSIQIDDLTVSAGVLYGWDNDNNRLLTIDSATGVATVVGGSTNLRGLAADSGANFFGAPNPGTLFSVDEANGATNNLGAITGMASTQAIKGMAFDTTDVLYAINFSRCCSFTAQLYTVDTTTRVATLVADLPQGAISLAIAADYADTDSDGIPDLAETTVGLDPNDASDAAGDLDSDGLSNLEEFTLGSNLQAADTDGDGLTDGDEVNTHGTDPLDTDTDSDGIFDGGELAVGLDPAGTADARPRLSALTDGSMSVFAPVMTSDNTGKLHLVWMQGTGANPDGSDTVIYYALLAEDGSVLIAPTAISTGADHASRPAIAVNNGGDVYVIWQTQTPEIYYTRLDPSAAAQDGSASDIATLTVVPETLVVPGQHAVIAAAAGGGLHMLAPDDTRNDTGGALNYYKLSDAGVPGAPTLLDDDTFRVSARIAEDTDGNVHVAWNKGESGTSSQVFYALLQGSDGSVLIAPTPITTSDGFIRQHTNLLVDAQGMAYLVWADKSLSGNNEFEQGHEIAFAKLDPAADDQDGDTANPADIVLAGPLALTPNDGRKSSYVNASFAADGQIHVTYKDNIGDFSYGQPQPLFVMTVDDTGSVVTAPHALSLKSGGGIGFAYAAVANDWVAWKETTDNPLGRLMIDTTIVPPGPQGIINVQSNVGSILSFETLAISDLPQAAQDAAPADTAFPDGLIRFAITDIAIGEQVVVTVTLPEPLPESGSYYKWDIANGWHAMPYLKSGPNEIQLVLTDGGAGDADGQANGQIVDPGGFATSTLAPAPTENDVTVSGSGSGGCTLNPQADFDPLFPALLLIAALYLLRRRALGTNRL